MNTAHIEFSDRPRTPETTGTPEHRFGWFGTPDPAEPPPAGPAPQDVSPHFLRFTDPRDLGTQPRILRRLQGFGAEHGPDSPAGTAPPRYGE
ncbi:hypothetical protein DFQ14_11298 [Halopolyspora algeriensis]|uniref:Uncharacterized protein n=1 Tax=Halopolyspora algeriensis TaxID=1500506 RepID=A0A368VGB8_9ACTN|nr:hypothetical protein [Halopolyspora algeriensis]RCW40217.1 hypothetical protein DFQ14_11298 [Halopolyspora algeriensis]TQM46302.1 hypothetical protein FHU43_3973 [Halopolyspora algeriensis]